VSLLKSPLDFYVRERDMELYHSISLHCCISGENSRFENRSLGYWGQITKLGSVFSPPLVYNASFVLILVIVRIAKSTTRRCTAITVAIQGPMKYYRIERMHYYGWIFE